MTLNELDLDKVLADAAQMRVQARQMRERTERARSELRRGERSWQPRRSADPAE